jgi:hypothetical protein
MEKMNTVLTFKILIVFSKLTKQGNFLKNIICIPVNIINNVALKMCVKIIQYIRIKQ